MAVGPAFEAPDSPSGDFAHDKYTITRRFKVQSDTVADGPLVVTSAIGVPRLYEPYIFGNELQLYVLCRQVQAERLVAGGLTWIVTATYTTPEPKEAGKEGTGQDTAGQFENPLLELAEVEWSEETVQVPLYGVYDPVSGDVKQLKNSAGQLYDPPPMLDQVRFSLKITRNESINAPHPATALAFCNTCNSDTFWGASAGQARCKSITPVRQVKNLPNGTPFTYQKVTYNFSFLAPDWDLRVLDAGDYYMASMAAPQTPFLDDKGNPTKGLLDGSGGKLASGGTPVFNSYRIYKRQAFAPLNLPQSMSSSIQ